MAIEFTIEKASLEVVRQTLPTKQELLTRLRQPGFAARVKQAFAHYKPANRLEECIAAHLGEMLTKTQGMTTYIVDDSPNELTVYAAWCSRGGRWRATEGRSDDMGGLFRMRQDGPNLRVVAKSIYETFRIYKVGIGLGLVACVVPGLALGVWWWIQYRFDRSAIKDPLMPAMIDAFSGSSH